MNLKYKLLIGIHAFIAMTSFLQSCCEDEIRITDDGFLTAYAIHETDDGDMVRDVITTVSEAFLLRAYFNSETSWLSNISFIQSSYATSCDDFHVNAIDEQSLRLSVNKGLVLNGDSIAPNSNLLELENSGIIVTLRYVSSVEFEFTEEFFSNVILENGDCVFEFHGKTDDNIDLNADLRLNIEI